MVVMVEAKAVPKEAVLTAVRMGAAKVEAKAVLTAVALTGVQKAVAMAAAMAEVRAALKVAARAIHKVRNTADNWPAQMLLHKWHY